MINTGSRWKLTYSGSSTQGSNVVFNYQLSVRDTSATCLAVNYRAGNCCNQTLIGLSFPLLEAVQAGVGKVAWSTMNNVPIKSQSWANTEGGVRSDLVAPMFTTSLQPGGLMDAEAG